MGESINRGQLVLQPRVQLRPLRGGRTHVLTPTGRTFKVNAAPDTVWEQLRRHCAGEAVAADFVDVVSLLGSADAFRDVDRCGVVITGHEKLCGAASAWFGAEVGDASSGERPMIGLYHTFEWPHVLGVESQFRAMSARYLFVLVDRRFALVGPVCGDPVSVTYRDVWERTLCASWSVDQLRLDLEPPAYGDLGPHQDTLLWVVATARERALASAGIGDGEVWELGLSDAKVTRRPVLPMPHRARVSSPPLGSGVRALVDARLGIVTKVEQVLFRTPAAFGLHAAQAWSADMRRAGICDASAVNAGCSFRGFDEAEAIAIAETAERYCANFVAPGSLVYGHASNLRRRHEVIDIYRLALFSAEQYGRPNFPFAPIEERDAFSWTAVRRLDDDRPLLAPASLVYLNWNAGEALEEQRHHPINFVGVSAGVDLRSAAANALEELVERDTMMLYWLTGRSARELIVHGSLASIVAHVRDAGYECWFLALENEFAVPTVAAVIIDVRTGTPTVGYASRNDWASAATKAWTEAVALQESINDLQSADGLVWKRASHRLGRLGMHDRRDDRLYADVYAKDFSDVTGLFAQLQLNLDPRVAAQTLPLLRPAPGPPVHTSDGPYLDRSVGQYLERIESAGYQVYFKDLTTADVASAGLTVVRALAPGLLMNFPTAYPPLGSERLQRFIGCQPDPDEINFLPLPYA